MCCGVNESMQHLFLDCTVVEHVWDRCLRWVRILSVQHRDLKCHFEKFYLVHFNHKQNMVWKGMWVTVVRCIWEQRNLIIFKQGVVDEEEIFHLAQIKAWLWMKHGLRPFNYSLADNT